MSARRFILLVPLTLLVGLILYAKIPMYRLSALPEKAMAEGFQRIIYNGSGLLQNYLGFGEKQEGEEETSTPGIQSTSYTIEQSEQDTDDMETFMKNREKEYERRHLHMKKVCEAYGKPLRFDNFEELPFMRFRWLMPRKFMVCFNAKVGTSTWTRYMLTVAAPDFRKRKSNYISSKAVLRPPYLKEGNKTHRSKVAWKHLGSYTKLIPVRDPFVRIVSAYKGKIRTGREKNAMRGMEEFFHLKAGSFANGAPFEAFVKYIVHGTSPEDDVRKKMEYFTNVHWCPFYTNCAVCDIDYTIIVKTETVYDDLKYVVHRFGLNVTDIGPGNKSNTSSADEAPVFFRALPRNLTLALYERYRPDFELFDYSVEKYLAEE